REALLAEIDSRLRSQAVCASLIWSVDEAADVGLLDVLPARATKLHAVEFLAAELGIARERLVFAGDSGNDLPVLVSGMQAVLVRNAHAEVRAQATQEVAAKGLAGKLYLAQGDFMDMNGNYSAGVLEGLAHFVPETVRWLSEV
ncbi:MAG: haloacid dehalogenase, partial [Gammaproteobacteria bacterium SG8_47]